jgi:hypothetical protein
MKKKTNIAKNKSQQGDVILRRVDTMPDGAVRVSRGRCVLAEGEHTGHAHVVDDDEAELVRIGERMLLRLGRPATVVHEEHNPITLDAGVWEVGRVQEYDYFSKMARAVQD